HVSWKVDVSLLTQTGLHGLSDAIVPSKKQKDETWLELDQVVGLIGHKNPILRVFEANCTVNDTSSLWLDGGLDKSSRAGCSKYQLAAGDINTMLLLQSRFGLNKVVEC